MAKKKKLRVLDLFSGLGGWSQAFLDRGHSVLRIDNDPRFLGVPRTVMGDVELLYAASGYDVILASPPCQAFSLAAGGRHLRDGKEPVSAWGAKSIELVRHTLDLIEKGKPRFWWMENPNGGMVNFVPEDIPRVLVTYCQYGETRMKLTNLWGKWPDTWVPRPRCYNGDPCHQAAKRGAKTGTQGIKGAANRSLVPYELSLEVCLACEAA